LAARSAWIHVILAAAHVASPHDQHCGRPDRPSSLYASGGEAAVKAIGGRAATLLLEHLKQQPMPILDEERDRIRVD
jgi:hypothetical protein